MNQKAGRNDPCPCGSGKKYKQCCLKKSEEQATAAKYTPTGKRKFKATLLSGEGKSLSIFEKSTHPSELTADPEALQRLKFKMAQKDYRQLDVEEREKETTLPFDLPSPEVAKELPSKKDANLHKPGDAFEPTSENFQQ